MSILNMTRGDTKTVTETIAPVNSSGQQVLGASGVTGWLFWMTAKHDPRDTDAAAVFQKLPVQWTVTQAGNLTTSAIVFCILAPADTASLPPYQSSLYYDVQAKDTSGNIFTIDSGTLIVSADVTIATS